MWSVIDMLLPLKAKEAIQLSLPTGSRLLEVLPGYREDTNYAILYVWGSRKGTYETRTFYVLGNGEEHPRNDKLRYVTHFMWNKARVFLFEDVCDDP